MKRGEADGRERARRRRSTSGCSDRSRPSATASRRPSAGPASGPCSPAWRSSRGQVVTVDRLVDDVWAGEPPATAVNTLQSYVSLLRRALGDPQLLRREGPGYVLAVDRRRLRRRPLRGPRRRGPRRAATTTRARRSLHVEAGLAEWHGPVLADVVDEEWARPAAVRWDELRLEALETRFDALLALGRHGEAVGELERTTDEHPLREGFARRLMIALYRSGRQADALRVYSRDARRARRRARPRSDARAVRAADGHPQPRSRPRRARAGVDGTSPPSASRPTAPPDAAPAPHAGVARRPARTGRARRRRRVRRPRRASSPSCTACGRPASAGGSHIALLRRRGRRRQVAAGRPLRRRSPRARRHRPVGPGDGRGDRPVRADGRGHAHGAADGVPRGPAPGRRRARPARSCCSRSSSSSCPKPGSSAPIRASSATSCSRPSPSCCAPSRPSTRC